MYGNQAKFSNTKREKPSSKRRSSSSVMASSTRISNRHKSSVKSVPNSRNNLPRDPRASRNLALAIWFRMTSSLVFTFIFKQTGVDILSDWKTNFVHLFDWERLRTELSSNISFLCSIRTRSSSRDIRRSGLWQPFKMPVPCSLRRTQQRRPRFSHSLFSLTHTTHTLTPFFSQALIHTAI